MPAPASQTRLVLLILIACSALAFALPTWHLIGHLCNDASARGRGGTFTQTLRFERRAGVISARTIVPTPIAPPPKGEVIGTATIVVNQFASLDEAGKPLRTEDTFACTWAPARPTDDAIDGIVRAWGRPPQPRDKSRAALDSNLASFTLAQVLKSPSGGGVKHNWSTLLAQAFSKTSDGYILCGFFFLATGIAFYVARRQKPRPGICQSCGYSTAGLTTLICPECGSTTAKPPH